MLWEVEERTVSLSDAKQVEQIKRFLASFELSYSADEVDYTVALYRDDKLIAVGSLAGEVLRNIAVAEGLQGEGLTAKVVSHLQRVASKRGVFHYFIYTKPESVRLFTGLGFKEIARAEPYAALLEAGLGSIEDYCREISEKVAILPPGSRAALVVNCNPFTLGHQAVIAKAAEENASVVVFVVSEDKSVFSFSARFRMVQEGTASLTNVLVVPTGKYAVSAATFPGYFTKESQTVAAQTRLDAAVFAARIAPALGITFRYVGEEPYCNVTRAYNQALADILPQYGIACRIVERIQIDGFPVSASRVRQFLREDDWEGVRRLIPDTTLKYLFSDEARKIIAKLKEFWSRH